MQLLTQRLDLSLLFELALGALYALEQPRQDLVALSRREPSLAALPIRRLSLATRFALGGLPVTLGDELKRPVGASQLAVDVQSREEFSLLVP